MAKVEEAAAEVKPSKYDRPENWKPPPPKPAKKAPTKKAEPAAGGGDDDLLVFDMKPKKAPPKNIGQRPAKKKPADEEMKDEGEALNSGPPPSKPPGRKPPALSSDKPKTASVPSKGPSAPVIHEEDLGSGLSKEEAIDKATEFYSSDSIKAFEESKWQSKQEGFKKI